MNISGRWHYNNNETVVNPWSAEMFLYKPWRPKGFSQFKVIIKVLVSSFWFIWIPMLWVYDNYNYFYSYSAGIDFSRQNLTSTDVRFWRLKLIPALQGLSASTVMDKIIRPDLVQHCPNVGPAFRMPNQRWHNVGPLLCFELASTISII